MVGREGSSVYGGRGSGFPGALNTYHTLFLLDISPRSLQSLLQRRTLKPKMMVMKPLDVFRLQ